MVMRVTLVLADRNYSAWSMVAWLAAHAASRALASDAGRTVEVTDRVVPLRTKEWADALRTLVPRGNARLPAMWVRLPSAASDASGTDGGHDAPPDEASAVTCVTDSLAICETLAELAPAAGLWPPNPAARAVARSICCEIHSSFMEVRSRMPYNIKREAKGRALPLDEEGRAATHGNVKRIVELWRQTMADSSATGLRRRDGGGDGDGDGRGEFLFGAPCLADVFSAQLASRMDAYAVPIEEFVAEQDAEAGVGAVATESRVVGGESEGAGAGAGASADATVLPPLPDAAAVRRYMAALRADLPGAAEWRAAAAAETHYIPDFEVRADGSGVEGEDARPVAD